MFPKPILRARASGTVSGSPGNVYESYDGTNYTNGTLVLNNADDADVLEYEYWNGSAWVTVASEGAFSLLGYAVGIKWRYRLVNAYFGTTGAWVESTAGAHEDTGGEAALEASFPAFTIPGEGAPTGGTLGSTTMLVEVLLPISYDNARLLYGKKMYILCQWAEKFIVGGAPSSNEFVEFTFDFWPTPTIGWFTTDQGVLMNVTSNDGVNYLIQFQLPVSFIEEYDYTINAIVRMIGLYPDSVYPASAGTYAELEVNTI